MIGCAGSCGAARLQIAHLPKRVIGSFAASSSATGRRSDERTGRKRIEAQADADQPEDVGAELASHLRTWASAGDRKSTRELQSPLNLVCRLLLEKKKELREGEETTPTLKRALQTCKTELRHL